VLYALGPHDERAALAEMFRDPPWRTCVLSVAAMNVLRGDHSILSHEVRRYSMATLAHAVTQAGFAIERITYTNATLFLPLLALRTLHRSRGLAREAEAHQEIAVPGAPLNAVFSAVLFLESLWLRRFSSPVGSSCSAWRENLSGREV
jgi:hypothetical protein